MATIEKRGRKWRVLVRRKGSPARSRTFNLKTDAQTWARQIEIEADRAGLPPDPRQLKGLTTGDLIRRYRDSVTPTKRGHEPETYRLNAMLRAPFARLPLMGMEGWVFANYRDDRLKVCKPETVRKELALLQRVFEVAKREWSIPLGNNPLTDVLKPSANKPRDRRLDEGEAELLLAACSTCRNPFILPMVRLAIETGMRRGELLNASWDDIDMEARTLRLHHTKNGHPRTVPLSSGAVSVLQGVPRNGNARVFPITLDAFKLAWRRVQKRAGIRDLCFHDLRHEAVSRFFERGLSIPEVALISGHRDPRMLFRYTHLRAEDVAAKLG